MASPVPDPATAYARKLCQRWIGAPQTGDLNDWRFVAELLKDLPGLAAYLNGKNKQPSPANKYTRKLCQRWIGARQSGDLNDPAFVVEFFKDMPGLQSHLIGKAEADPAPIVPEVEYPGDFKDFNHTTPNQGGKIEPEGFLLHHSGGSFQGSLSWCKQSRSQVSYHTLIHPDGSRHHIVPTDRRAWHAGRSSYQGRSGCNGFLIGVAFSGDSYSRSLTGREIASAREFFQQMKTHWGWKEGAVTNHAIVSPGRKNDLSPGEFKRAKRIVSK